MNVTSAEPTVRRLIERPASAPAGCWRVFVIAWLSQQIAASHFFRRSEIADRRLSENN